MPYDAAPDRRQLLGQLVRERRMALGLSLEGAAREAGVAKGTWRKVEEGAPAFDSTLGRIESFCRWRPGTVLGVLDGRWGDPLPLNLYLPPEGVLVQVDLDEAVPVGSGVDPLDLSALDPEDREYIRSLYERLRKQRGE